MVNLNLNNKWVIISALVFLGLAAWGVYFLYNEKDKHIDRLEQALKKRDDELKLQIEKNIQDSDSIIELYTAREEEIRKKLIGDSLYIRILDSLNRNRYDPNIDNMRDSDSIYDVFAKYYPDNN